MLAADVSLHADGGGKRPAVTRPVLGFDAVMKLFERLAALFLETKFVRAGFVNGLPGFITLEADRDFRPPPSKSKTEKSRQFTWCETLTS